ncbi:MAG: hypothetical protein OIF57_10475 [Marinobacterium sp.]|nr:hypothetical protein [Marinobacterium sp.]
MTTFIVDGHSAACDSLWTDGLGNSIQSELYKYLFIPRDNMIREGDVASVFYYAGSAEAILMHQAFVVDVLSADEYLIWSDNLRKARPTVKLGFCEVELALWIPQELEGVSQGQGVIFGGTGGRHAFTHYRDNYCTESATEHAIQQDKYSGPPIVHYCSMNKSGKNVKDIDKCQIDIIYADTSHLINDLQASGESVVSKFRYTGCSTAEPEEAPAIDIDKLTNWVKKHEQRRKQQTLRNAIAGKPSETRLQAKRLFDDIDDQNAAAKMA